MQKFTPCFTVIEHFLLAYVKEILETQNDLLPASIDALTRADNKTNVRFLPTSNQCFPNASPVIHRNSRINIPSYHSYEARNINALSCARISSPSLRRQFWAIFSPMDR